MAKRSKKTKQTHLWTIPPSTLPDLPVVTEPLTIQDRYRGALLGLAAGDALGTTLEFTPPLDPFTPRVVDIVGGGPFFLVAGQWTDDTSMALCAARSLVDCGGFDAADQMDTYLSWYRHGFMSVKGYCFDIGGNVCAALRRYEITHQPYAGDDESAGNGSLMRLAPVPMAAQREIEAVTYSALSSMTTHGATEAVDACRFFGLLLWKALHGASKDDILAGTHGIDLCPKIDAIARGSYKVKMPPAISGSGYVVHALEAALWAFSRSDNYRDCVILAANLGQDADSTAAIAGSLAGAFYGLPGIPESWRAKVAWNEDILELADQLLALSRREW